MLTLPLLPCLSAFDKLDIDSKTSAKSFGRHKMDTHLDALIAIAGANCQARWHLQTDFLPKLSPLTRILTPARFPMAAAWLRRGDASQDADETHHVTHETEDPGSWLRPGPRTCSRTRTWSFSRLSSRRARRESSEEKRAQDITGLSALCCRRVERATCTWS